MRSLRYELAYLYDNVTEEHVLCRYTAKSPWMFSELTEASARKNGERIEEKLKREEFNKSK